MSDLAQVVHGDASRAARARVAAESIRRAAGARWVGIYSVTGEIVTNVGWSGPSAPAHPTFPVSEGLTCHAIAAGSIVLSNDVARDPRYLTNQDDTGSELIVPVLDEAAVVVGTLDVESADIGAFGGSQIVFYEQVARALRPIWNT